MAYNREAILKQALEATAKECLYFIQDVIAYIPISSSTFYEWEMEKSETLLKALEDNKINTKVALRDNWKKSDAPALQIALMKIIATDDEAHRLNGSRQEFKHDGSIGIIWNEEKTYEKGD